MRFNDINLSKPIININSGKILGYTNDIDLIIDNNGNIISIEIRKRNGIKMVKDIINWSDVKTFCDVILVDYKRGDEI